MPLSLKLPSMTGEGFLVSVPLSGEVMATVTGFDCWGLSSGVGFAAVGGFGDGVLCEDGLDDEGVEVGLDVDGFDVDETGVPAGLWIVTVPFTRVCVTSSP